MATEAEHLRLHLALTEIRDNTVQAVINKDVGAFEIPMQNTLAVQIRHPLRDLMHHLEHIDGSVQRETLEVLDQITVTVIRAHN